MTNAIASDYGVLRPGLSRRAVACRAALAGLIAPTGMTGRDELRPADLLAPAEPEALAAHARRLRASRLGFEPWLEKHPGGLAVAASLPSSGGNVRTRS